MDKAKQFIPVKSVSKGAVDSLFTPAEIHAFLRQHLGYGSDASLRWGSEADVAWVDEQEKALASMLQQGDGKPTSYYEMQGIRWLRFTSYYSPEVKGIMTEIEGNLLIGMVS